MGELDQVQARSSWGLRRELSWLSPQRSGGMDLAVELRQLVGYGLTRRKLSKLPGLMALGNASEVDALIRSAVAQFDPPEREVFDLLLVLTRRGNIGVAPVRRRRAMELLKYPFSLRDFIEEEEPRLFERLAEMMVKLSETSA